MSSPPTWTVESYQDRRGRRPVEDWLDTLELKDRARVNWMIALLENHGTRLGMPYSRHLRGRVWELRVSAGRRDYRILYAAVHGRRFILLHAFSKQSAKTPARDLAMAEQRLSEFEAASQKGH